METLFVYVSKKEVLWLICVGLVREDPLRVYYNNVLLNNRIQQNIFS